MGNRLTKIYTRTGDQGVTGLADGARVDKDSARINAMGDIDELNSVLGVVIAHCETDQIKTTLADVQHQLFDLGGELSLPDQALMEGRWVEFLEQRLDQFNAELPPLKEFILPGGGVAAAYAHLARAVCRRAERRLVTLSKQSQVNEFSLMYLNRLSDLLFVFARVLARQTPNGEVLWCSQRSKG